MRQRWREQLRLFPDMELLRRIRGLPQQVSETPSDMAALHAWLHEEGGAGSEEAAVEAFRRVVERRRASEALSRVDPEGIAEASIRRIVQRQVAGEPPSRAEVEAVATIPIPLLVRYLSTFSPSPAWPRWLVDLLHVDDAPERELPRRPRGVTPELLAQLEVLRPAQLLRPRRGVVRVAFERGPLVGRADLRVSLEGAVRAEARRAVALRSPASRRALAHLARACQAHWPRVRVDLADTGPRSGSLLFHAELPPGRDPARDVLTVLLFVLVANQETREAVRALQEEAVAQAYLALREPDPQRPRARARRPRVQTRARPELRPATPPAIQGEPQ